MSSRVTLISTFVPFFQDLRCHLEKIERRTREFQGGNNMGNDDRNAVESVLSLVEDLYLEMFRNQDLLSIEKNEDFVEWVL